MTLSPLTPLSSARLRPSDLLRLASVGLRTRPLRAALSALGIAIGVAAVVAVLGLSSSSDRPPGRDRELGTNLLIVPNGVTLFGHRRIAAAAPAMIARIGPVTAVQETGTVSATVYRNPLIPPIDTDALSVEAAEPRPPRHCQYDALRGAYLDPATATEPVAVLGAVAAQRLGIDRVYPGERIWLGGQWFYVAGILNPAVLVPNIDSSVLVGFAAAETYLGFDGHPSTIYVRAQTDQVTAVQSVLAATANPEAPNDVDVSQPSTALVAQADAQGAFDDLFLGLGAVALLVGAVGVANIMVISVLERRSEIGLRRALGATKGQIRLQFLSEAILLALLGGIVGVAVGVGLGALSTLAYADVKGSPRRSCPPWPGRAGWPLRWSSASSPGYFGAAGRPHAACRGAMEPVTGKARPSTRSPEQSEEI